MLYSPNAILWKKINYL